MPVTNKLLDDTIKDLAKDLAPIVDGIEKSPKMTQNHYGRYMDILTQFGPDKNAIKLTALALLEAGANRDGLAAAMRIHQL